MSHFLASLPLWLSAFLVIVLPTVAAMAASLLLRQRIGLERLATNNEVAGFKFAVLGVIYAVLLGFAVIVVWEKFHDAEAATVQEAAGIIGVWHLLQGFDGDGAAAVQPHLTAYVKAVIAEDWPAMGNGKISARGGEALDALYAAVLALTPATPRESAAMAALLSELDTVTQGRRTRLILAQGVVPEVLWFVLLASAFVTLGFTFFFGTRSAHAQALMTGMLAATIFMALYVVIEINYPFTGPVKVQPEALELVLERINGGR